MQNIVDRVLIIFEVEDLRMPWLEKHTGVEAKRWHSIKQRGIMRTSELEALIHLYPEYAYWLATGKEMISEGQLSPKNKYNKKAD